MIRRSALGPVIYWRSFRRSCRDGVMTASQFTALLDISCVPETPLRRHNGYTARLSDHPPKGSRSFGLTHACQRRSVDTEGERLDAFCAPSDTLDRRRSTYVPVAGSRSSGLWCLRQSDENSVV